MPLLALEHVTHRFGAHVALDDVSLRLEPGLIGLLGPNGAGKSTLLKIIMGLLAPSSGGGEVLGQPLASGGIVRRRLIGYMSEADALVPGLRGVEYVSLAGELCGMPTRDAQRRAHELLTYLGMEEARYRKLEEYSTGMRQRIKLAQALVHDPPLLLLDEPTSGLDPAGRDAMLKLLAALGRDHGKSLLLSTHVLSDVERVCDQAVILFGGKILRQGKTQELRTCRRDRYRLEVDQPHKLAEFAEDLRLEGATALQAERRRLKLAVPEEWPTRHFFALADNAGLALRGLERDDEDLEQLFLRVMDESKPRGQNAPRDEARMPANGIA